MSGKWLCFVLATIALTKLNEGFGLNFRQEMAKVDYFNPKYLSNITVFTSRQGRYDRYKTCMNATSLRSFGNNVTIFYLLQNLKTKEEPFHVRVKTCDILKWSWLQLWLSAYTNIPLSCPVPAGNYLAETTELPPKNLPIILGKGDYKCIVGAHMTTTKEIIAELSVILRNKN